MKNLVICCDWIGNEISENISNVLTLYLCMHKREDETTEQVVYYDPGVGRFSRPDPWQRLRQDFTAILGLATGYALDDHVLAAYMFLVQNYEEGDAIYLFGFSRGAFCVRMLAGLIHKMGLVWPDQANIAGSLLFAYKQSVGLGERHEWLHSLAHPSEADGDQSPISKDDYAGHLASLLAPRLPTIRFVGVFDTVASTIVPRPDRLYWPSFEEPAFTLHNPSIAVFRQAISIDERRAMFRLCKYEEPQIFVRDRMRSKTEGQDILQVWFAGVHADIGGGYPEKESGLSKYPLLWMINEAERCGLKVNSRIVNQLAWGIPPKRSSFSYAEPNPEAMLHQSLHGAWWLLEFFPKNSTYKEWPTRQTYLGRYIPDAEPRPIPDGALIHESVVMRMKAIPQYRPVNLPDRYGTFPMPTRPTI